MTAFDPATRLARLEQQLAAFERLHADELREFQRRLEAYQRLHEEEVRLLREEIAALRAALAAGESSPPGAPPGPPSRAASSSARLNRTERSRALGSSPRSPGCKWDRAPATASPGDAVKPLSVG
jgi:hypothetical protein